ncbi:hypothetical protein [Actinomadura sp. 9N407]|uniref:effector-associated constant component EACC1 n=1 Tax=Actinomadura sp. 9N407 TaxID=3375154 RepID=UPI00378FC9D4
MELRISAADDGDVVSLYRWFAQDASVSRHARVSLDEAAPRPGSAAGTITVINVSLQDSGAVAGLGTLVIAFTAWRGTRSRPAAITVHCGDVTATLTDGSEAEIQPLLDALLPPPSSATLRSERPEVSE